MMYQVQLDATRKVVQMGQVVFCADHLDDEGNPTILVGLGERDGCTIETVDDATYAAIQAALPDHGAGVRLSEDHLTVTPLAPDPDVVAERAIQRAADAELAAAVAAHKDPVVQALAKRFGLV